MGKIVATVYPAWSWKLLLMFIVCILFFNSSAFSATEMWVEGSGFGETKKEAKLNARLDAIWKVLYKEIGEGADVNEDLNDIVKERIKNDINSYVANSRLKSYKKDGDDFIISLHALVKLNRVAKLAKEVMKTAMTKRGGENPSIMFFQIKAESAHAFKDRVKTINKQFRSAFIQEFKNKGLTIKDKDFAIKQYEKAVDQEKKEKEEEEKILALLTNSDYNALFNLTDSSTIKMAKFLEADYYVQASYEFIELGENNSGRMGIKLNIPEFKVYRTKDGFTISTITDFVSANGVRCAGFDPYKDARLIVIKKAALILVNDIFGQIIEDWSSEVSAYR